jgi:hypothetical protein
MRRCIYYYLDLDKEIEIGLYEIYVLYTLLVIRI